MNVTADDGQEKALPAPAPAEEEPTAAPAVKVFTADEVRSILIEKTRAGKKDDVQRALRLLGVSKLSEVKPEDYADLVARVEYFCGDLDDQKKGLQDA